MPENVLFIGHSLVGQAMPSMFNSFLADQNVTGRADAQVINGAPLRWNWDNGDTAEGVNARAVLPGGTYDAVVVTEAIPLADQILWNDSQGYAKRYYDLAIDANPDTRFYLYETWHYIGEDTDAWRAQIAADLSAWESIVDHINTSLPQGAPPASIVPAGQAMGNLHDAIAQGSVPGLSSIRDLFSDDIHLNDTGNWFVAALQAEVVAGLDAADLPLNTASEYGETYQGPSAAMARAFNDVIDQTLADYARDGVSATPAPSTPFVVPVDPTGNEPEEDVRGEPSEIAGDRGDNELTGNDTPNLITARAGDDTVIASSGRDTIDGGTGEDSVVYPDSQDHYTMTLGPAEVTLQDRRRDDTDADTLVNVETVQFAGTGQSDLVDLSDVLPAARLTAPQMEQFVELYIAYFDRAPDAEGLYFWAAAHSNGMSLQEIASRFIDQTETRATYPAWMNNDDFATAVYDNVLGRAADADGFEFWTNALDTGDVGRDQFILAVLEGAKASAPSRAPDAFVAQQAEDRQYLSDKTDIGAYYAVHMGLSDVDKASAVMDIFDGSDRSFDRAVSRIEDFRAQVDEAGSETFLMPLVGVLDLPAWA